jgi:D-aspartate ligase
LLRKRPLACVIGTIDLVRPLGLAGIRCAVVAEPGDIVRYSRFTSATVDWVDPWKHPEELVERLIRFAKEEEEKPVLYYEGDWDLLVVSRYRDRLSEVFRFVVPDATLVEDLVDKARFRTLANRLGLPVPRSVPISPAHTRPEDVDLPFPLIIKPLTRQNRTWEPFAGAAKAVRVETPTDLRALWSRLAETDEDVLAQELIPGSETLIESYHVYVDNHGEIAGEFTGRKIRTYPASFGFSTALTTTDAADVADLGRDIARRLDLRGVAKLDFKRSPDGQLALLEVNLRFNLWHHLGARAGVNLPSLVYSDLVGLPRPIVAGARAGVRWCYHRHDARAARAAGIPLVRWLPWALTAEAKSGVAWDDPLPLVGGSLWRLSRRLKAARKPAAGVSAATVASPSDARTTNPDAARRHR